MSAATEAAPTPPPKSKLLPLLLVFNSLLLLGVGAVVVLKSGGASHQAEAPKEKEAKADEAPATPPNFVGPTVKLPDFVVRLRNPEQDRFARMSFEVEVSAEPDKERINVRTAKIRDTFIRHLSDCTVEELRGSEGLDRTKDELTNKLKEIAPDARIRSLYITEFVVQ